MVPLTRLNGARLHLNGDLIAMVEEHHDTVVTLVDGKCLVVAETAQQVVAAFVQHRAEVLAASERLLVADPTGTADSGTGSDAQVLTLRPHAAAVPVADGQGR